MPKLATVLDDQLRSGASLHDAIDELVESGDLRDYIWSLTTDPPAAEDHVQAYIHPNGFLKVRVLTSQSAQWAVRIHVWNDRSRESDIHNHRWDFASRILRGRLRERRYSLVHGGDLTRYSLHKSPTDDYRYEAAGTCGAGLSVENDYAAGDSYFLDHSVLHAAESLTAYPTVTAVMQGPSVVTSTTVLPYSRSEKPQLVPVRRVGIKELMPTLRDLVDWL